MLVCPPAASVTVDGETPNATELAGWPLIESEYVCELPLGLVSVTVAWRVWPLPDGTAPKLTLTRSSEMAAFTADNRFSRPVPLMLTLFCSAPVWKLRSTPRSAVLTTAERARAAVPGSRG